MPLLPRLLSRLLPRRLPLLLPAVLLAVVAVRRPDLLTSAAGSPRAWGVAALVVLASTLTRFAVRRWTPLVEGARWAGSAVATLLLAALLLPSFAERTVNEAFPPVAVTPTPTPTATAHGTATPHATATTTTPPATGASVAVRLATGRFHGIGHRASGGSALYDVAGRTLVRFEDVDFQGTPSPSVHLVASGRRTPSGGIRLGALTAEHGAFSYRAPVGFNPGAGWTVLVWCDTYATPIAAADLAPTG